MKLKAPLEETPAVAMRVPSTRTSTTVPGEMLSPASRRTVPETVAPSSHRARAVEVSENSAEGSRTLPSHILTWAAGR